MQLENLTGEQLERLRQISQAGMDQAAGMLSRLLGGGLGLQVCRVALVEDLSATVLPAMEETVVGVSLEVTGELKGSMFLCLSRASAEELVAKLLRRSSPQPLEAEPARSTLKEIGNILASAFLARLDTEMGIRALPSPPGFAVAPLGQQLAELQPKRQEGALLVVETRISSDDPEGLPVEGAVILLPEKVALELLIDRIQSR